VLCHPSTACHVSLKVKVPKKISYSRRFPTRTAPPSAVSITSGPFSISVPQAPCASPKHQSWRPLLRPHPAPWTEFGRTTMMLLGAPLRNAVDLQILPGRGTTMIAGTVQRKCRSSRLTRQVREGQVSQCEKPRCIANGDAVVGSKLWGTWLAPSVLDGRCEQQFGWGR
jgi:hypothetical protein